MAEYGQFNLVACRLPDVIDTAVKLDHSQDYDRILSVNLRMSFFISLDEAAGPD